MNFSRLIGMVLLTGFFAACVTEFKPYEARVNVFEGRGGTKTVVDGMEIWDTGEPPRRFMILGIIDDQRPGGPVPMASLRSDIVQKAKEAGGDAVIQLTNNSQFVGFYSTGSAYATTTVPMTRNYSRFAVIKFIDSTTASATSPVVATPPPPSGLNGTYSGEITGNAHGEVFRMQVTFTVVQSGDDIAGAWTTTSGTSGTVTGMLTEAGIRQLKARQLNPCAGEFSGVAVIEAGGARLRGSYVGTDCNGSVTASFVVNRQ